MKQARGDVSQTEFARALEMSQPSYSRCEAGYIPDGETLLRISMKLGIPMEQLLTGRPPGPETLREALLHEGIYFEPADPGLAVTLNKKVTLGQVLAELGKLIDGGMTPREILTRLRLSVSYSKKPVSSKAKSDAAKLALEVSDDLTQKKPSA